MDKRMNRNEKTLTYIANQAILSYPLVEHYPDPNNRMVTFPPSLYYRFLKSLAENMKSNLSVELGVCGGGGSLHLAMSSKMTVGVDAVWDHEDNLNWIIKTYLGSYIFLQGDSVQLAQTIYERFGKIDLLFIDTTHTYEQTLAEFNAYSPYLSDKAVVCLDDLFRPGMDKAWDWMPEPKLRLDQLHVGGSPTDGGFGVVWKK